MEHSSIKLNNNLSFDDIGKGDVSGSVAAEVQTSQQGSVRYNSSASSDNKKSMTLDDKKRRRWERNRESARECRKRKREKFLFLVQQVSRLEAENFQIRLGLKVGPDSVRLRDVKIDQITNKIQAMVENGSSDSDLLDSINELQERYSDYGKDRQSIIDFHIRQLKRCLRPSTTTRTMLWLISCVSLFHNEDGSLKDPYPTGKLAELWTTMIQTIKPTSAQLKILVDLSNSPVSPTVAQYGHASAPKKIASSSLSSSLSTISSSTSVSELPENQCEAMLLRLEELITSKNHSLDNEMSEVQALLSANQIAKYILWVQQNPVTMQMLEQLWPHTMSRTTDTDDD